MCIYRSCVHMCLFSKVSIIYQLSNTLNTVFYHYASTCGVVTSVCGNHGLTYDVDKDFLEEYFLQVRVKYSRKVRTQKKRFCQCVPAFTRMNEKFHTGVYVNDSNKGDCTNFKSACTCLPLGQAGQTQLVQLLIFFG